MPRFRRPSVIWILGIPAVIVAALVVGVYAFRFGDHLSANHERWGQFGEYLGGVLGPLLSFLALLAVVGTLQLQLQQFDATFFNLMQSVARIREGKVAVKSLGIVATPVTSSQVVEVPIQLAIRDAWEKLKRMMNARTETSEDGARLHLVESMGALRREYGDAFRLADKIFQIYRFIYRARLTPEERGYYVEIVNSEITPIEHSLVLFALLTQPTGAAAFKVINELQAFITLDLRSLGLPRAYSQALKACCTHLTIDSSEPRPVLPV